MLLLCRILACTDLEYRFSQLGRSPGAFRNLSDSSSPGEVSIISLPPNTKVRCHCMSKGHQIVICPMRKGATENTHTFKSLSSQSRPNIMCMGPEITWDMLMVELVIKEVSAIIKKMFIPGINFLSKLDEELSFAI